MPKYMVRMEIYASVVIENAKDRQEAEDLALERFDSQCGDTDYIQLEDVKIDPQNDITEIQDRGF